MSAIIVQRSKEPVFVVAEQADDFGLDLVLKLQNGIHAAFGVWTPVDVVAQEDNRVTPATLAVNLVENVVKRRQISVDVADCNGSHAVYAI